MIIFFFINTTRIINIVKNIDYIINVASYYHIIYYNHLKKLLDMIAFNNSLINKYKEYVEINIDNILKYQTFNSYDTKFNFILGFNLSVIYSNNSIAMKNNFNNINKNFIYNFFILSGINIESNNRQTLNIKINDYAGLNINIITKYDIKNKDISINFKFVFDF